MSGDGEVIKQMEKIIAESHGWFSLEKAKVFANLLQKNKPQICVEVGVFGGKSLCCTATILKNNGTGCVHGIDPWTKKDALEEMKSEENKKWWSELDIEEIYEHCKNNIIKYNVQDYCKLIRAKSEDVVNQFEDGSVSFAYLDGNHSEALSYKDATLWLPKIKSGGFIAFDDIFWVEGDSYVTTRKAILYLTEHCQRIDIIDDCMLFQKK